MNPRYEKKANLFLLKRHLSTDRAYLDKFNRFDKKRIEIAVEGSLELGFYDRMKGCWPLTSCCS